MQVDCDAETDISSDVTRLGTPIGWGKVLIITCFQTRLQLVKELGGDDLKHDVEEVEVR